MTWIERINGNRAMQPGDWGVVATQIGVFGTFLAAGVRYLAKMWRR